MSDIPLECNVTVKPEICATAQNVLQPVVISVDLINYIPIRINTFLPNICSYQYILLIISIHEITFSNVLQRVLISMYLYISVQDISYTQCNYKVSKYELPFGIGLFVSNNTIHN